MSFEDYKVEHESTHQKLKELKTVAQAPNEKEFLKDLEDFGIEAATGKKELFKLVNDDLRGSLFYSIGTKLTSTKKTVKVDELSQDEITILGAYIESKEGDDGINLENIVKGNIGSIEKEKLQSALVGVVDMYKVLIETQGGVSVEKMKDQEDAREIKPLTSAEHLRSFVTKLPDIFKEEPMVFSEDVLEILKEKITLDAFEDYYMGIENFKDLKSEEQVVVGLFAMLKLNLASFPLDSKEEFLKENSGYYANSFKIRMEARAFNKDDIYGETLKDKEGKKIELNKIIGKDFKDFTKGDLSILLENGNIGKYFLHGENGDLNFGNINKDLEGKEFLVNFHENSLLDTTLGLGMLLANKGGPYVTKIKINGEEAILKIPDESKDDSVTEIGYYYTNSDYKDPVDGDSYAEVYDKAEFTILEVSDTITDGGNDVTNNYKQNIDEFIDINRGEDVDKMVDEMLLLGGLDLSKITTSELEGLKAHGYDISKLFLFNASGNNFENGLDDLIEDTEMIVKLPSKELEDYLSAGLLLAPNIFGDKGTSDGGKGATDGKIITEIEVNGHRGRLMKVGKKVGFYGTTQDAQGNSFDKASSELFYREIHSGYKIKILKRQTAAELKEKNDQEINKSFYGLSSNLPDIRNTINGKALSIYPKSSSEIDKKLLLESLYKKLNTLGGGYAGLIVLDKDKETGNTGYRVSEDAKDKGLYYNQQSGAVQISSELRGKMLEKDFQDFGAGIDGSFSADTYKNGLFLPPAIIKRWNPNTRLNKKTGKMEVIGWVPMCGRTWRHYRSQFGLSPRYGDADKLALSFGPYSGPKIRKYPKGSKSTIKAVVDGKNKIDEYIGDNLESGKFDFVDIFSEGTSPAGQRLSRKHPIGVGHAVSGVVIHGKIYVADPYHGIDKNGEKNTSFSKDFATGRKVMKVAYSQRRLIPFDTYKQNHNIRRVVFHDAPGIDNKIAKSDYEHESLVGLEGEDKYIKLQERLLENNMISRDKLPYGIGVPSDNFRKNGVKILKAIYENAEPPFEPALILAQMMQESGFSESAGSHKGAQGYMQFMPAARQRFNVNPQDLNSSVQGAVEYLKVIYNNRNHGAGNLRKTLWGYNAGEGNVYKVERSGRGKWKEPKNYANKILKNYQIFKRMGV